MLDWQDGPSHLPFHVLIDDMDGRFFGRLLVIGRAPDHPTQYGERWVVRCQCGREKAAHARFLLNGSIVTCGQPGCRGTLSSKRKNLIGLTFGKLRVLRQLNASEMKKRGPLQSEVQCDCGIRKYVREADLIKGTIITCGSKGCKKTCYGKHGRSATAIYTIWQGMKARCNRKTDKRFAAYGAKGIEVCPRWLVFEQFLADVGERPSPAHSLDRINGKLGYFAENVRWATAREQAAHTTKNVFVHWGGKTQHLAQWGRELGILACTLYDRHKAGKRAPELFAPVKPGIGRPRVSRTKV